ncbi:hypothetical protein N7474_009878 [Penicillium riverlandense]|uniref:uncharacterized protein n=1 Tax=Penicillium riverlandense TaxID=1903569 RepID=UPI0025478907|nr:uncharacterized protein N7474_009878 [Penicillium riverlandense]KAJ5808609.1 hypothetical protein N7474_009878 [Penicillium riverlandense]
MAVLPSPDAGPSKVRSYLLDLLLQEHEAPSKLAQTSADKWVLGHGRDLRRQSREQFSQLFGESVGPYVYQSVRRDVEAERRSSPEWKRTYWIMVTVSVAATLFLIQAYYSNSLAQRVDNIGYAMLICVVIAMAEVVGVVSSAITFATVVSQVTESIITIRDYWSQFRDAPNDLKCLMRDLELFGLILAEIEEDLSQDAFAFALKGSKHALQSLEFCREAATNLQTISDDLLHDMNSSSHLRKSYAAAKVVMQRGKVERHIARLRNAIQLLSLSQQSYTSHSKSKPPDSLNDTTERVSRGKMSHHAHASKYLWRLSLPSWLSSKALEVYSERVQQGWQWVFRTYNVIPSTSKVVSSTVAGNIEDLQNLFATKQASPFDRTDRFGYTLLHYAMLGPRKEEVLKFLLNQEVDSSIAGAHPNLETPLNMLVFCGTLGLGKGQPLLPCLRLLLRYTKETSYEDTPEETIGGDLSRFRGSSEEFRFLQQHCCPSYYEMPQETRIAVASKAAFGVWDAYHMPKLIETMLGPTPLSAKDLQIKGPWRFDSKNTTLVHCVVRKIGASQAALQGSHPWKRQVRHQSQSSRLFLYLNMREGYYYLYKS